MDNISGYTQGTDIPIKNAIIRSPGVEKFIAYSDKDGHYATFAFTVQNTCKTFSVTAVNPFTMYRDTQAVTKCEVPYVINNLNFKLADKNTTYPDKTAPVITVDSQVAPGQTGIYTGGTLEANTELQIAVTITDEDIKTVTLSAEYTSGNNPTSPDFVQLTIKDKKLKTPLSGTNLAIYTYTHHPYSFKPTNAGLYTIIITAVDTSNNTSTSKKIIRVVEKDEQPSGFDGPPIVELTLPEDKAEGMVVSMPIIAYFNEPVQNITETTFKLIDLGPAKPSANTAFNPVQVPAFVTIGIESGRVTATLLPKGNLYYDRKYEIVLTKDIKDAVANPSATTADKLLNLKDDYRATFTTKTPTAYDIDVPFQDGRDIALYTEVETGKTHAYVSANANGWRVVDVTDPTVPVVKYSQNYTTGGVSWFFRGVAVDQDEGILALTENIAWNDSGQYGYVRFYSLLNPASPTLIGKEKIAESYSGIPGKVAITNSYAYILTTGVGMQVVDINAAKNHTGMSTGETIVGIMPTVATGYGQPWDINIYTPNKALLTTSTGHLLTIDLSIPYLPTLITAFRPDGYTATRVAALSSFGYIDGAGNNQNMDLAITGSRQGKINTIDITDPYNPTVIGTAKDQKGSDFITNIMDIAINKKAGLAFITSYNAIQIIDIKDPKTPRLLNTILSVPDTTGTSIPIGPTPSIVEQGGWVYLANQSVGMRALNIDPVYLKLYCDDSEFKTVSKKFCTDYYPGLGTKEIIIQGFNINMQPIQDADNVEIDVINWPDGVSITSTKGTINKTAVFKGGLAKFYIDASNANLPTIPLQFKLKSQIIPQGKNSLSIVLAVRNNGNVTLGEVLKGEAVFVHDCNDTVKLCSEGNTSNKFSFVQEQLNQVVPRARTIYDDTKKVWISNNYKLISEEGLYNDETYSAVQTFKQSFAIQPDSDIIKKLKKDYALGSTDGNNLNWEYKIIDKETLVGKEQKIPSITEPITASNADTAPNSYGSNSKKDTGLYELYKNVVERFIESMIQEGEKYINSTGSGTNTQWISRTGDIQTQSVSYCFGCKNKYDDFWSNVTSCLPPKELAVSIAYAGNVNDDGCGLNGGKRYPGLKNTEINKKQQYYAFDYWTGIDCAGFVQRMVTEGKNLTIPGVNCKIPDLKDRDVNPVNHLDDGGILAVDFFTNANRTSYWVNPEDQEDSAALQKKLKRGDLVRYGTTHISTIYTFDKKNCTNTACTYEIIHAYGGNTYQPLDDNGQKIGDPIFSRKVIKTKNNIGSEPTGFGRVKLWD